jgi:hypothetical protein
MSAHYHSLSIHGVLNALVFMTFFICGFLPFIVSRALEAPLANPGLGWVTFWIMTGGARGGVDSPRRQCGNRDVHVLSSAQGMFLVLSTPIGIHHQYTDPGIHRGWKLLHAPFTVAVFFPSLLTFFNVVASLETRGRARGGAGWINWFGKLPWSEQASRVAYDQVRTAGQHEPAQHENSKGHRVARIHVHLRRSRPVNCLGGGVFTCRSC